MITRPNPLKKQTEQFESMTGHTMLAVHTTEDKLGYILDNGTFVKQVWGGRTVVSSAGESMEFTYTRENFDKLRLFLGDQFNWGVSLETAHHVDVSLEDIQRYEIVDYQPLVEYMGEQFADLVKHEFVVSMIKVTKFSMRAYKKVTGKFGTEFQPYPLARVAAETGGSLTDSNEYAGYNVFVGYRMYDGYKWWDNNFEKMPKVTVEIESPAPDSVIDRVRTRVRGSVKEFSKLPDAVRTRMRLYVMTRDEYEDNWLLQSKATIDEEGVFEGIARLGTLDAGDGHRYSLAVFVTYFDLNREVNSTIPYLPFNMGKQTLMVTRKDSF